MKMEDAQQMLRIPESECPDVWKRVPRHKWLQSWSNIEDPVVPLERYVYGHPLAGLLWEGQFCWNLDGKRYRFGNVCVSIENKDYPFLYAGKKQNMGPMWKKLMKKIIWMNQYHVLTTCMWDPLNVYASRTNLLMMNTENVPITNF